jgi:hypothetical protein
MSSTAAVECGHLAVLLPTEEATYTQHCFFHVCVARGSSLVYSEYARVFIFIMGFDVV